MRRSASSSDPGQIVYARTRRERIFDEKRQETIEDRELVAV